MSTISADPKCPRCGAALPADAVAGLCPRCLMVGAMQATQGDAPATSMPSPTPEEIAVHFPQLEIIEFLGRGGMGVVYKARQKALGRLVALKLLAPERVADPKFAQHFAHEAQALAALSHPNIVTIHDFGQAGGFFYLLMEFVDGVNLRQAMKAGRFTPEQALAIVPPVCEALQYAHEHGIVHRDIKPENLLLDREGRVKIADFGIAKILGAESSGVGLAESQPVGTPQYMAPEQKAHRDTDHRADIYSLGVVLYEMLTGERPSGPIVPPSKRVQVDVRIDEIVLRALETAPELRFATAAEFRTQVEVATGAAGASGGNKEPSTHLSVRRSRVTLLAVGAALVLMPLIAFLAMRARQSGRLASEALLALAEQKAASFSPVVERVISLPDDSAETCALDLDSGKFVPAPKDVREAINNYFILKVKLPESEDRIQRWARATGADLLLVKVEPRITLASLGGGIAFPDFSFSKTGHEEVARLAVEAGRHPQGRRTQPTSPFFVFEQPELDHDGVSKAVFFQTREGGPGLLQIVGSADGSDRIRIRYKLLVSPDQEGAPDFPVVIDTAARTFPLQHAFAEDIIAGGLKTIVSDGPGNEVRATGDNQKVIVKAPADVMKRVQTFITVMDWPDAIRRNLIAGLPFQTEYPQDTVMHTARAFFHACAMEDTTESFERLLSPQLLAELKGDTKSREFESYQMDGVPDEAWEKSLRADWPGKAQAIQRLLREWNRYPLKRITEDSGVLIGFGEKHVCTVTFDGAPQGSYPVTIEPARTREGQIENSYLFSSLPPWWKMETTAPAGSGFAAKPASEVGLELRIIELPDGAAASPVQNNLAELRKIAGADIYSVPAITAPSGEECEITTAGSNAADALAPTPHGIIGLVRPILEGETVHYVFKFSLSIQSPSLDAGRTHVQEIVRNGDAQLDHPLVVDLGIGEKGRRQLVWMVFHGH